MQVHHNYREANTCVNMLAKHIQVLPTGLLVFSKLPLFLFVTFMANMSSTLRLHVLSI